ncbi:GntR family transcriptional regulator [uncultured Tistrella sp.]|uniref:GntR family transcriptional regulator n=1 Tax=Tistrella mobilis TaxID=171437 RepID=UPI000C0B9666|nr:GntR family transcriptional regulator [uncultured Tistrella sp.]MAM74333.1 GntR family transcriptional regulator [Tistrella sp.]
MLKQSMPSDERLPAYLRLRDELAARIAAGEWGPDHALPSENALARDHRLSVGTVRKAVQQLVDEGLLERRQGSGTYLRKPAFDATLFRFFQMQGRFQMQGPGEDARSIPKSQLITRVRMTAPEPVAAILGTADTIRIERVRSLSGRPILAEEIYIRADRFEGLESLPAHELGPLLYPVYYDRFGVFVARAIDDVSFGQADATTATRLGIAEGAPVACIERTAFTIDGTAVEWRIARGDALNFRYRSRIG